VTIAVANGDLSKKITVDVRGEILQLKEAINTMVDQLRSFASEVTRVAREVGTDGKLAARRSSPGVAGNLEGPDRFRERHVPAIYRSGAQHRASHHRGRARRPFRARSPSMSAGEILELKDTMNTMVDQLNAFASEVYARGARGRHRGQARRPGAGARHRRHLEGTSPTT